MATTVFLVEDHPYMRQIMGEMVARAPDLTVCGEAASAEEALEALEAVDGPAPDVALVDISLPQMSGLELVRVLRRRWPEMRCLVVSGYKESNYVQKALSAGAQGYLLKGDPLEVQEAIREVMAGKQYISRSLAG